MNRYLLTISYIGTRFRGIQKSIDKTVTLAEKNEFVDLKSIQGILENSLKKFKPVNEISVVLSSRTDAGVHAIQNSVHVDLERRDKTPYNPTVITRLLNQTLYNNNWHIRVLNTFIVPDTFHCRFNAKSRTYLYRFAVRKDNQNNETFKGYHYVNFIPIEEIDRCFFIQNPVFDVEKAREAIELFKGRHDFRTFMGKSRDKKQLHPTFTWRKIDELTLQPGKPSSTQFSSEKSSEIYNYWDIKIKGRSFLYRQVRRIAAVIIAVGQGKITHKDCYEMLTIPSKNSWLPCATVLAPYGLFLCNVEYDSNELKQAIEFNSDLNKLELSRCKFN